MPVLYRGSTVPKGQIHVSGCYRLVGKVTNEVIGKVHPRTDHEGADGELVLPFRLTSVPDGVGG